LLPARTTPRLKTFEQWLGQATVTSFMVFAHPQIAARALGEELDLPEWPPIVARSPDHATTRATGAIHEADGLEWPLRLAVVWQEVAAAPMRRTQQGDFFKRDVDRLRDDPVLNSAPADAVTELPDISLFTAALAVAEGVVKEED